MKKQHIFISIIILLLISNIITLTFNFNYRDKCSEYEEELKYNIQNIYFLDGENNNWRVTDGELILGRNKKYFNGGVLEYIGDKELNIKYLELSTIVKEKNSNKIKERLDSTTTHEVMPGNDMNLLGTKKLRLGSARRTSPTPIKYDFDLNLKDDVYVKIKYRTAEGKNKTEELRLNSRSIDLSEFKK